MLSTTPRFSRFLISSKWRTPPEATMRAVGNWSCKEPSNASLAPCMVPSRSTSVTIKYFAPAATIAPIRSVIGTSDWSSQPSAATLPFLPSTPITMRSGPYSAITCFVNSGFLRATEPRITRLTPISKYKSTASLSRIPPPISNTPVNAARTRLTISTLTGFPAFAPSKSTRCKAPTPAASY